MKNIWLRTQQTVTDDDGTFTYTVVTEYANENSEIAMIVEAAFEEPRSACEMGKAIRNCGGTNSIIHRMA